MGAQTRESVTAPTSLQRRFVYSTAHAAHWPLRRRLMAGSGRRSQRTGVPAFDEFQATARMIWRCLNQATNYYADVHVPCLLKPQISCSLNGMFPTKKPVVFSLLICLSGLCNALGSENGGGGPDNSAEYLRLLANVATDIGISVSDLKCSESSSLRGVDVGFDICGEGFHRTIKYAVRFRDVRRQEGLLKACRAVIVQRLPRDVFVDPFQIERISCASVGPGIELSVQGVVDLEQPAPVCENSLLVVKIAVMNATVDIDVPIHARYAKPRRQQQSAAWWNILSGDLVAVRVPPPILVLLDHCLGQQGTSSESGERVICGDSSGDSLHVPSGNVEHRTIVAWGTLIVVWGSTLMVLVSLCRLVKSSQQGW